MTVKAIPKRSQKNVFSICWAKHGAQGGSYKNSPHFPVQWGRAWELLMGLQHCGRPRDSL